MEKLGSETSLENKEAVSRIIKNELKYLEDTSIALTSEDLKSRTEAIKNLIKLQKNI